MRARGVYQKRYLPLKVWGSVSVTSVEYKYKTEVSHLLLPHIPLIIFLDILFLRTMPTQARFLPSLLLRIGAGADGWDTIDRIIRDLDVIRRQRRRCRHGRLAM